MSTSILRPWQVWLSRVTWSTRGLIVFGTYATKGAALAVLDERLANDPEVAGQPGPSGNGRRMYAVRNRETGEILASSPAIVAEILAKVDDTAHPVREQATTPEGRSVIRTTALPRGWTLDRSVNGVDHLLDPQGRCATCGRTHSGWTR